MTVRLRDTSAHGLPLGVAQPVPLGPRAEGAAYLGRPVAEMKAEHQEWLDSQPTSTSCLFCDWTFDGTAAECRDAAAAHREQSHPDAQNRLGRRRGKSVGAWRKEAGETASAERAEANRLRAEREDADRLAKIERGRQRDALAKLDAGEPQDREEEIPGARLDAEQPEPQPGCSPPPRDETGLEETPAAEDAALIGPTAVAGDAGADAELDTYTEGIPMNGTNGRAVTWTRERMVQAIRDLHGEFGRLPTTRELRERHPGAFKSVVYKRLGVGLNDLIREAGFEPRRQGQKLEGSGREPLAGEAAGAARGAPATKPPVTPAAGGAAELASRPEHSHLGILDLIKIHDELDDGTLTVTRWNNGEGDHDPTAEDAIRQIVSNAIADYTPDEIGHAILARLRPAA